MLSNIGYSFAISNRTKQRNRIMNVNMAGIHTVIGTVAR